MFYGKMTDAELQELATRVNGEIQRRTDFRSRMVRMYSDCDLKELKRTEEIVVNRLSNVDDMNSRMELEVVRGMIALKG